MLLWLLNGLACAVGWLLLLRTTLRVVLGPAFTADLHERLIAYFLNRFLTRQPQLQQIKETLFQEMKHMKPADGAGKDGALEILEVGVGCGANLAHYPAGSSLTCVDPNPHVRQHFERACADQATHLSRHVRFVVGVGERMAGVADCSVDAVVVTLVLCSVGDVASVVREVYRVLKPGGKFFYLEHIAAAEGTVIRRAQDALTDSGLWPGLARCWLNRDPSPEIRQMPFRSVEQSSQPIVESLKPWNPMKLANTCLTGVATK